ncbi:MAG: heme-binding protein [Chromatiaceae bacterium]
MKNCTGSVRLTTVKNWSVAMAFLVSAAVASMPALAGKKGEDDLPTAQLLSLQLAIMAAVEAESTCAEQGYRVSVAVVDRGGLVKAHIRGDGSGPHTLESARKKAYTSASLGRPTTDLVSVVVSNPAAEGLRDMNESILILGGGLPIVAGGEIIGGIGVGGAPGGDLDEECAQAGLDRIDRAID